MQLNVDYSKPAVEIGLTFDETHIGFGPILGTTDISRSMTNISKA